MAASSPAPFLGSKQEEEEGQRAKGDHQRSCLILLKDFPEASPTVSTYILLANIISCGLIQMGGKEMKLF